MCQTVLMVFFSDSFLLFFSLLSSYFYLSCIFKPIEICFISHHFYSMANNDFLLSSWYGCFFLLFIRLLCFHTLFAFISFFSHINYDSLFFAIHVVVFVHNFFFFFFKSHLISAAALMMFYFFLCSFSLLIIFFVEISVENGYHIDGNKFNKLD